MGNSRILTPWIQTALFVVFTSFFSLLVILQENIKLTCNARWKVQVWSHRAYVFWLIPPSGRPTPDNLQISFGTVFVPDVFVAKTIHMSVHMWPSPGLQVSGLGVFLWDTAAFSSAKPWLDVRGYLPTSGKLHTVLSLIFFWTHASRVLYGLTSSLPQQWHRDGAVFL